MPTLADLQKQTTGRTFHENFGTDEEALVSDTRSQMRPTECVERKLQDVLQHGTSRDRVSLRGDTV